MEFCPQCDNMIYLKTDMGKTTKLVYYCKHCGYEDERDTTNSNSCVYDMDYETSNYAIHTMLNEYTYADPTLPRVNNVDCPNEDCGKQLGGQYCVEIEGGS